MSGLKYVLIEMIENDVTKMTRNSIIAGTFRGIRIYAPPEDNMLVIVDGKKDETHLLNTEKYNVLSLQKFDGFTKIVHCFRAIEEDQTIALNMLSDIVNDMNADGRTIDNDDNIIDTATYTCVPDDVTIIKSSAAANTYQGNTGCGMGKRPLYDGGVGFKHKTNIKTEPAPKHFKRSRKPGKDALKNMAARISEIKAGTYQVKLPTVSGDEDEIAETGGDQSSEDRNYYMHG